MLTLVQFSSISLIFLKSGDSFKLLSIFVKPVDLKHMHTSVFYARAENAAFASTAHVGVVGHATFWVPISYMNIGIIVDFRMEASDQTRNIWDVEVHVWRLLVQIEHGFVGVNGRLLGSSLILGTVRSKSRLAHILRVVCTRDGINWIDILGLVNIDRIDFVRRLIDS